MKQTTNIVRLAVDNSIPALPLRPDIFLSGRDNLHAGYAAQSVSRNLSR